jgi:uncharacterized protein YfaS (alpha-2-macroglobulin family)
LPALEPPATQAGKLVILPESFLRGYDPVTVFFPKATASAPGPEDHPERYVTLEPEQPGAFRWADTKTLLFVPTIPWPPLARFSVTAGGVKRELFTLMAPPTAMTPSDGQRDLDPVDEVTLTFAAPVAVDKLAKMVSFELRSLPGVESRASRVLGEKDYAIKALERASAKDPAQYAFRFRETVQDGVRVVVRLQLSLDERSHESSMEYAFSTKDMFRVVAAGCLEGEVAPSYNASPRDEYSEEGHEEGDSESGDEEDTSSQEYVAPRGAIKGRSPKPGLLPLALGGTKYGREQAVDGGASAPRLAIEFSAAPETLTLSMVKALLRTTPAIPEMTFSQSGLYLYVTGKVDRDTLYQAEIMPAIVHDLHGRLLQMAGPSEFYFYFPRQSAYLRWAQSQGILERYGPQMFPLSGRGDTRVDLRIYKIEPLNRGFWPFPSNPIIVDEQARPPGPGEEPPSAETLNSYVSPQELARRIKLLGSPAISRIVNLPLRPGGGATGFGLPLKDLLAEISGAGAPGTYLVGIRRLNAETNRDYVRFQVTDLCLSTVEEPRAVEFFVTSLKTGLPVQGASVRVERQLADQGSYDAFITGTTDAHGLYRWEHRARVEGRVVRIAITHGEDTLVILPSDPPYAFANNHWHGPRGRWLGWMENDPLAQPETAELLMAHILTERPVYRPEEEVHVKGYLRLRDKGRLELPPAGHWELVITDPGDKEFRYPVEITAEGSFYAKFQERDLPSGKYKAVLHDIDTNRDYGSVDWRMEAYRIPRFEVSLHGPDQVPMDREFTVTATADYYAGGRVVGQDVAWRVTQFPYDYVPKSRPGFLFSSDERFSKPSRFQSPGALEKRDKTDATGASALTLNPALEMDARPRRYVCEVTVTGADEQTVSTTKQVLALPPFILGLKVNRFQAETKAIRPEIIAVDGADALVKDLEVTVRLLQRQWHSALTESDFSTGKAKYLTEVVDKEITKTTLTTSDQPLPVDLAVQESGIYVVEVSARDKLGRLQIVSVDLYVGGKESLTWKKPEANIFETSTDKTDYNPGEAARILLKSPYQNAHVLAIVEAPDGNVYEEFGIQGGRAVFNLPIQNAYNPRIPIHFLLMRGRVTSSTAGHVDLGKPGTMAATCWLKVNPVDDQMTVALTHPEKVLPGQQVTIRISLSTPGGKPIPGEVTLWLVDQAVLSLGKEKRLDPLPSFIRDVDSALTIRDTRNSTIGEILAEESPGGGGTEEENGLMGRVTVRKDFRTVPYFNPRILVDASGTTEVTFKISDDLTNFKVRAVACSGPGRFGSAKSTISVRLPVIVQPALPRFARIGDSFTAGGIGRVVEGEGGAGRCEIQVEGADISAEAKRHFDWQKEKPERLFFPMKVLPPAVSGDGPAGSPELTVRLAVQRDADKASDAFVVKIPVLPDRDPVRKEVFKNIAPGQTLDAPEIPGQARQGSIRRSILVTDQEAILKMIAGLDYLYSYPYGCTEQRVSCAYPLVALKSLFDTFHMQPNAGKTKEVLDGTFDYLEKTLQPNGLYSYWPGGKGYVSLTAYVVSFLSEAKRAELPFAPKLIEKPVAALKQALRSDYSGFIDGAAFMERCEALQALSSAGEFDTAYGSELARKAGYLDLYSEAQVLTAYYEGQKGGDAILPPLRKDLWDNTVFKLRDGKEVYGGLQSRIKEWGGLVLSSELKTQAAVIRALYPGAQNNPKMRLMVNDLVEAGAGDGWGNTNANAAALLALRDVVQKPSLLKPQMFDVAYGGKPQTLQLGPNHPTDSFVTSESGPMRLTCSSGKEGQSFFARFTLAYLPVAGGESVAAASDGFVVRREIVRVPNGDAPPQREWLEKEGATLTFHVGDVVEEHAQVINPEERHFVVVVVPFAAGMEPLNPNLATAPKEAQPSGTLTLEPSYAQYLDNEVRFYYETLPAGTFDFFFRVRAMTVGNFVHPASHAEMMYREGVRGNSAGARYVVEPREEK